MADNIIRGIIELALKGEGGKLAVEQLRAVLREQKNLSKAEKEQIRDGISAIQQRLRMERDLEAAARRRARQSEENARIERTAFGSVASALQRLYALIAGSVLFNFLKNAYLEFAKTERSFNALFNQIQVLGAGASVSREQVRGFVEELSKSSGILDDDLIPALNAALLRFGDYQAAQEALRIATRFAANGIGDVQNNVEALAQAMQTGQTRALAQFGVAAAKAADGSVDLADALRQVREKADQLPETLNDAQSRVGALSRVFDKAKDAAAGFFDTLAHGFELSRKSQEELDKIFKPFEIDIPKDKFDVKIPREEDALARAFREAQEKRTKAEADAKRAAEAAEDRQTLAERLAREKEAHDREGQAALDHRARQFEKELAQAMEAAEKEIALERRQAQERLEAARELGDAEAELEAALADERLSRLARDTQEWFEAQKEAISRQTDLQVAALEAQRSFTDSEEERRRNGAEATQLKLDAIERKITSARLRESNARREIDKAEQEVRRQAYLTAAHMILDSLETIFGENKAVAIANALVNTYEGITKALTLPFPLNFVVAGLVGAAGFAQVRKITQTSPGGGGAGESGIAGTSGAGAIAAPPPPVAVASGPPSQVPSTETSVTNYNQSSTTNNWGYPSKNKIHARRQARILGRLSANDPKRQF